MQVLDNTPQAGFIQWSDVHISYKGKVYNIANGATDFRYIYWKYSDPNSFYGSNVFPTLGDNDLLVFLNKNGIHLTVPTATIIDGSLIVPESIYANALAANSITSEKIVAGAISSDKIAANAIGADKIAAGAIMTNHIQAGAITANSGIIASAAIGTAAIQDGAITNAKISNLDAGKINTGYLNTARLQAGTITADKLVLSDFTNLCENPDFETDSVGSSPKGFNSTFNARVTDISGFTNGNGSNRALEIDSMNGSNSSIYASNLISVTPGQQFFVSAEGRYLNTNGTGYGIIGFRQYDAKKTALNLWDKVVSWSSTNKETTFTTKTGIYTVPNGCYYLQIWISFYNNAETTNKFYIDNIRINRAANAELIVDGAITAQKIASKTITANEIASNTITANEIVSRTITSDRIAANAITANELAANAVTAGKIDANAITAREIKAGTITANEIAANTITTNLISTAGLDAAVIKFGTMSGERIEAGTLSADKIKGGTISGVTIKVDTTAYVGNTLYLGVSDPNGQKTILFNTNSIVQSISGGIQVVGDGTAKLLTQSGIGISVNNLAGGRIEMTGEVFCNTTMNASGVRTNSQSMDNLYLGVNNEVRCVNLSMYNNGSPVYKPIKAEKAIVNRVEINDGNVLYLSGRSGYYVKVVEPGETSVYQDLYVKNLRASGQVYTGSSVALKTNIKPFDDDAIDILKTVNIYTYYYQDDIDNGDFDNVQVGVLAEAVPQLMRGPDASSVSPYAMVSILWKAVQQQHSLIDNLQNQINDLELALDTHIGSIGGNVA
ncbi:tail fiber domain-containing protein [Fictibacillus sp. Mic-4]|uniref:tail fiber domain-containing protein n=1 Tax=Fictibacillus sp. Mic-4 TaxID=3132826 RepID=UPI003CEB28B3